MFLVPGSTAHAQTAPTLSINTAHAFRNVVEDGDIFVLVRYELPFSIANGVSDAWCLYLEDQTGCDGSPAVPEAPDTLLNQTVSVTFYRDCIGTACGAATILEFADQLPRIDHALAGVYFGPGHTLTWGTATYGVCIESNAVTFAVQEQECLNPIWNASATDQETQREKLGEQLLTSLRVLEVSRSDPPLSMVNGDSLITENGGVFAREAIGVAPRILPEIFQAAARAIATPFATPAAPGALQGSLDSSNTAFVSDWQSIGSFFLGQPGRNVTFIATILLGFLAATLVGGLQVTKTSAGVSATAASGAVVFMLIMTMGLIGSAVPVDGYFGWIFISSVPMAWWVVGKIRGG